MVAAFVLPRSFLIARRGRRAGAKVGMVPSEEDRMAEGSNQANTWQPPVPQSQAQQAAATYYPPKSVNGDASNCAYPEQTNGGQEANSLGNNWQSFNYGSNSGAGFDGFSATTTASNFNPPIVSENNVHPYSYQANAGGCSGNLFARNVNDGGAAGDGNPQLAYDGETTNTFENEAASASINTTPANTARTTSGTVARGPPRPSFQPASDNVMNNVPRNIFAQNMGGAVPNGNTEPSYGDAAASDSVNPPPFKTARAASGTLARGPPKPSAQPVPDNTISGVSGNMFAQNTNTGCATGNGNPQPFFEDVATGTGANEVTSASVNPPPFNTATSSTTSTVPSSARPGGRVKGVSKANGASNGERQPHQYSVKKSARSKALPKDIANSDHPLFPDNTGGSNDLRPIVPTPESGGRKSNAMSFAPGAGATGTATTTPANDLFFGSPATPGAGSTSVAASNVPPTTAAVGADTNYAETATGAETNYAQTTSLFDANGSSRTWDDTDNARKQHQQPVTTPFFLGSTGEVPTQAAQATGEERELFSQLPPFNPPGWGNPFDGLRNPFAASEASRTDGMSGTTLGEENGQGDEPFAEQISELDRMKNKAALAAATYAVPVTATAVFGITQGPGILDEASKAYESLAAIPWTSVEEVSSQNSLKSYMERLDQPWTDPRYASAASNEMNPGGDAAAGNPTVPTFTDNESVDAVRVDAQQRMEPTGSAEAAVNEGQQAPAWSAEEQQRIEPAGNTKATDNEGQEAPTLSLYTEYLQNPMYKREPKVPEPQPAPPPSYADDAWTRINNIDQRSEQSTIAETESNANEIEKTPSYADYMWERVYGRKPPESVVPETANNAKEIDKTPSYADYMWERVYGRKQPEPPVQASSDANFPSAADSTWGRIFSQRAPHEGPNPPNPPTVDSGSSVADTMWQRMQPGQHQGPTGGMQSWPQTQPEWAQQPEQHAPTESASVVNGEWAQGGYQAPAGDDAWAQASQEPYQAQPDPPTWTEGQQSAEGTGSDTSTCQPQPEHEASQHEQAVPAVAGEAEMLAPVSWGAGYLIPTNTSLF